MSAPPGGTLTGRVGITFPDPSAVPEQSDLYVHVWIGSGNIDPVLGTFLSNVDTRFPRLTEPRPPGLRPGLNQVPEIHVHPDSALLDFKLRIPPHMKSPCIWEICASCAETRLIRANIWDGHPSCSGSAGSTSLPTRTVRAPDVPIESPPHLISLMCASDSENHFAPIGPMLQQRSGFRTLQAETNRSKSRMLRKRFQPAGVSITTLPSSRVRTVCER